MQYMLLVYEPRDAYAGENGQGILEEMVARHMALAEELQASGIQRGGAGLQGVETATTVLTQGGQKTLHDGPFAETREHLGGYYLIDVPHLDDALAVARRIPGVDGTKIEVRPVIAYDDP